MKCKDCIFCTYSCPGYMCMNENHQEFNQDDDLPVVIELDDNSCELFCLGDNDYKRFLKETSE